MVEIGISLIGVTGLVALEGRLWRRWRGPAVGWKRVLGRWALLSLLTTALVGAGLWELTKSRQVQLFGAMVSRVETDRPVVALTFDDGPTEQFTGEVLEILREEGVRGTFFLTGGELSAHPELGQQIVADGHALGNHTFHHQRMVAVSYAFTRDEIERTDELIRAAGYEGEIYFRMPNCRRFLVLPYYLQQTGRTTLLWDSEPETGMPADFTAEELAQRTLAEVRPGSIVLLHVMYASRAETRRALPLIIQGLKARGYEFLTAPELLALEKKS